jgi:hypothetical protein
MIVTIPMTRAGRTRSPHCMDLDTQVHTVRRAYPVEGTKDAVDQLIITLGSAAVFGAVGGLLACPVGA